MGEMILGKMIAIDNNGNEFELGKGAIASIETAVDESVEDAISRATMESGGTLSVNFKSKRITKRKLIKFFMSKGANRNNAIDLYKLYINTMRSRNTLGLQLFMVMYIMGEVVSDEL